MEKIAVSLKTVNAQKNFSFDRIMSNIEELADLRSKGICQQFGVEYSVEKVRLDIAIPKGYNKANLQNVRDKADLLKVDINIFELD